MHVTKHYSKCGDMKSLHLRLGRYIPFWLGFLREIPWEVIPKLFARCILLIKHKSSRSITVVLLLTNPTIHSSYSKINNIEKSSVLNKLVAIWKILWQRKICQTRLALATNQTNNNCLAFIYPWAHNFSCIAIIIRTYQNRLHKEAVPALLT